MICEICNDGKDYKNLGAHKMMKHDGGVAAPSVGSQSAPAIPDDQNDSPKEESLISVIKGLAQVVARMDERLKTLEVKAGGKDDSFKKGALAADVVRASATRKNVDEKMVKIVDETLGEDFGVEVIPRKDQPGFSFTLIVPPRLSDKGISSRPIVGEDGKYKMDPVTNLAIEEDYQPEDRRTRTIGGYQSYEAIKDHCEKVRSYIVSYYQKLNRPIPEFRLKSYA